MNVSSDNCIKNIISEQTLMQNQQCSGSYRIEEISDDIHLNHRLHTDTILMTFKKRSKQHFLTLLVEKYVRSNRYTY